MPRNKKATKPIIRPHFTCILCGLDSDHLDEPDEVINFMYDSVNGKDFCDGCSNIIYDFAGQFIEHWNKFFTEHGFDPLDKYPVIDGIYIYLTNVWKQPVKSWGLTDDEDDLFKKNSTQLDDKLLWDAVKEYVESLVKILGYPSDLYITKPVEE